METTCLPGPYDLPKAAMGGRQVDFEVSAQIARPPAYLFAVLTGLDRVQRDPRSVVPVYEKTTPGPAGVGTRYREVVRVLPGVQWVFLSELTVVERAERLSMKWRGPGMRGDITYRFEPTVGGGTLLRQSELLEPVGLLKLVAPLIRRTFRRALQSRIESIKSQAEAGAFDAIAGTAGHDE